MSSPAWIEALNEVPEDERQKRYEAAKAYLRRLGVKCLASSRASRPSS